MIEISLMWATLSNGYTESIKLKKKMYEVKEGAIIKD